MTVRSLAALLVVPAALAMSGCGGENGYACTTEAIANFSVTVLDKGTGARLCDATVSVTDDDTSETVNLSVFGSSSDCTYSGGFYERPGNFTLTVSRSGYTTQTRSDIAVIRSTCHVIPTPFTVQL